MKNTNKFSFKKNGANGTRLVAAIHVTTPVDLVAVQLHGEETPFNSEEVRIEDRAGKGQLMVMVLMDNVVTSVSMKSPAI